MANIESVQKVFDDGMHNAFTDLVRWNGAYYLCFRRAPGHMLPPYGEIVVLRSTDLTDWHEVPTPGTDLDDRDPKFVVDGGRLGLNFGSVGVDTDDEGRAIYSTMTVQTYICWTTDGQDWSDPTPIYEFGWWLWRPRRFADGFWCAAAGRHPGQDANEGCLVDLLYSKDGEDWACVTTLLELGKGNEAVLHKTGESSMLAIVRGRKDETFLMTAEAPYVSWKSSVVDHWIHAPVTVEVGNTLVVAGRARRGKDDAVTRLWAVDGVQPRLLCDLPSGRDTSYCGLVALDERTLLVSYYSQHDYVDEKVSEESELPSAIYLAKVTV